nr:protein COBRA-like [Ipomoea batatas]
MGVSADAYDPLDPNGNITIKWDVISWTPDGYLAMVSINNFQRYRHIQAPGWRLGWTWAKKEIIWDMVGGQATEQGDCSKFKMNIPHCCKKDPTIVDLMPGTPYNKQVANCCRGGVLNSWVQDAETSVSAFQISVGQAGTTNKTVRLPKNFTLKAPGPGYTCGPAKTVTPTKFVTPDKRRTTQAMSKFSYFKLCYKIRMEIYARISCFLSNAYRPGSTNVPTALSTSSSGRNDLTPLVQCTNHMCPIRIHWHVKINYKAYWRVKVTITNFNYRMNYSQWNLVVQHPNFDNLTQIFSFNYQPITPYESINDTAMLWGIKFYNDLLMQAGPLGNVQTEMLFQKDKSKFTFDKGWAFPRRIYFNGDNCVMPQPDSYPYLPNASPRTAVLYLLHPIIAIVIASLVLLFTRA